MAVVILDFNKFRQLFPEFSNVSDPQITALFLQSRVYIDNTEASAIEDIDLRTLIIYTCMAHLAYLQYGTSDSSGGAGMVGRIASVSEGSVSISTEIGAIPEGSEWYVQSPHGFNLWQMLAPYRIFMWVG